MLVVQNLAKENYLLKFKMAAMAIYGKKRSDDFFSRTTVPISLHEAYGASYYIK